MSYIKENDTIYKVENIGGAEIKYSVGSEKRLELISESNTEKVYQWQKFDLDKGEYVVDENMKIAEIEGKEYKVDKGKVIVPKELSEAESRIKHLEKTLSTLGKQLVKEKLEGIKKDKTISGLGKHETKLSMDLMRIKNEVNSLKQSFEKDKKGGE